MPIIIHFWKWNLPREGCGRVSHTLRGGGSHTLRGGGCGRVSHILRGGGVVELVTLRGGGFGEGPTLRCGRCGGIVPAYHIGAVVLHRGVEGAVSL